MDSIIRIGKAAHDISLWVDAEDSRPKRIFHVDGPQAVVSQDKSMRRHRIVVAHHCTGRIYVPSFREYRPGKSN